MTTSPAWRRSLASGLGLCWLALSGCSLLPSKADRLYAERDLEAARDAYLATLERLDDGPRVERALLRLGLIYLQPNPALRDDEAARAALTRLSHMRPRSELAAAATMLLSVQVEATRLRELLDRQSAEAERVAEALASSRQLADASQAKSEMTERAAGELDRKADRLAAEVARLRTELEATREQLSQREQELTRLKSIDLESPP